MSDITVKEVPLSKGYITFVDEDDYPRVSKCSWYACVHSNTIYAQRNRVHDRGRSGQFLHTFITGWERVDHRDGNGLNNCRSNLRAASAMQNNQNQRKRSGTSSQYKGVYLSARPGRSDRWYARIRIPGADRQRFLGSFESEIDAAQAYDRAAVELFGEFARPNFR